MWKCYSEQTSKGVTHKKCLVKGDSGDETVRKGRELGKCMVGLRKGIWGWGIRSDWQVKVLTVSGVIGAQTTHIP